ncbi:MAG TPA: flagellar export protein FliJ [Spirochaetota bacterium]|nr:flagellar export protein FliJ [Spirochaetota bacterium]HOK91254.1 flagellar export protein FliJ [Spirochaetota bacterium]HPD77007.1 flagellar export protein FliJ [Spirochaetota bacterium]HPP94377.1 flagellar export protein FliJ [Spirochaetota bacterium]HRU65253.1 flagellar export protein FliJ [Spirochaetota bacterium]
MKRFQFKLQKLLDLREAKEKEIKNELMKVLSEQNRERNFQHELNEKIAEYEGKLSEMQKRGVFNPAEAMAILRFADVSRNAIVASEKRVQALEPEVQRIRERLVVASREKKVVEKLKERKLDEYNYELNREISKENDDMNQKIYHKKIM